MKILIWVQSGFGIGHLVMAAKYARKRIDDDVLIVYGGVPYGDYDFSDLKIKRIPTLVDSEDRKEVVSIDGDVEDVKKQRKDELKNICDDFKPDELITEHFPFGRFHFRDEVNWLVGYVKQSYNTKVLCLLRDFIGRSDDEFEKRVISDLKNYDKIYVASDGKTFDFKDEFSFVSDVEYIGYLFDKKSSNKGKDVLVTLGGGVGSKENLEKIIHCAKLIDKKFIISTGSNMIDADFDSLKSLCKENIELYKFVNMDEMLGKCGYFITTAGYNSCVDACFSGLNTQLIADVNNNEQLKRAERFSEVYDMSYVCSDVPNEEMLRRIKNFILRTEMFDSYDTIKEQIIEDLKDPIVETLETNKDVKVSVVIPFGCRVEHLKNTLQSLSNQSLSKKEYEVIVVDDDSGENVKNVFSKLGVNYSYIKYKRSQYESEFPIRRSGQIRNKGAEKANGEILVFLDSDMIVEKDFLEKHLKQQGESSLVVLGKRSNDERDKYFEVFDSLDDIPNPWHLLYSHNFSVGKKDFFSVGGFSNDFIYWGSEDEELGYKLFKKSMKFMFDESLMAQHQEHPHEISSELKRKWASMYNYKIFYEKYNDSAIKDSFYTNFESARLSIFDKCNNNCNFCESLGGKGKSVPIEQIKKEIDFAERAGIYVTLCGGEPAMHPKFFEILEYANQKGVKVKLVTNGRMFSYMSFARRVFESVNRFEISVFGLLFEHNNITKVPGSYEQMQKGVKTILSLNGRISFEFILNGDSVVGFEEMYNVFSKSTQNPIKVRYYPFDFNGYFNHNNFFVNRKKILEFASGKNIRLKSPLFNCYQFDRSEKQARECVKCEIRNICGSSPTFMTEKIVFFRDDDGCKMTERMKKLLDMFISEKLPIDLAVVPSQLEEQFVNFVLKNREEGIRFHQHGFDHTNHGIDEKYEFGESRFYDDQIDDIKKGQELMKMHFGDKCDNIFTPPYHGYNKDTLKALREVGFEFFSVNKRRGRTSMKQIPVNVDLMNWDDPYSFRDMNDIEEEIDAALNDNKVVGVLLHHEWFSGEDFEKVKLIIQKLKKINGVKFVNMVDAVEKI